MERPNCNHKIKELHIKYMNHPPEGLISKDIRYMSKNKFLDIYYFLNGENLFDDEAGAEGFYIF